MKQIHRISIALLASALALGGCKKKKDEGAESATKPVETTGAAGSASGAPAPDQAKPPAATKNLLDTAKDAGNFTSFLKAIDAAGIADKLNGPGPFTVFAPTDDAFAKVPAKDLDALLADKAKLGDVLQYHVVSGNLAAKDLAAAKSEKSVAGPELAIDATSGIKVAGATVTKPDLVASNGVIHGIDTVLAPPAK